MRACVPVACARVCVVLIESSEHHSSKTGPPSRSRVRREGAGDTYPMQPLLSLTSSLLLRPPRWLKELSQEYEEVG